MTANGDNVLVEIEQSVAVVTLNRPERLNVMTYARMAELAPKLEQLGEDRSVACVVLTGAGRAFCAGGDITEMAQPTTMTFEEEVDEQQRWHRSAALLHDMPQPAIAMVNGAAAGAGLSLAMACDIRIAGESAKLGTAFGRIGFAGDFGGTWLLTALVGTGKAREMYFTSAMLSAEDALRIGLVNQVVPDAELRERTLALAAQIAAGPAIALRYMKQNLNSAQTATLQEMLLAEARSHRRTGQTEDHRNAVRAFLEKRAPEFHGR